MMRLHLANNFLMDDGGHVERTPIPADLTVGQELDALGDEVVEMANLGENRTGIPGVVFISIAMGSHGPRVKYFEKAGRDQPSFSVSIATAPQVVANSLPDRVANKFAPLVERWVMANYEPLIEFWLHGDTLMDDEVAALMGRLVSL